MKTDVAVIILTKDERLHIGRCLERLAPLESRQIFVVDCFSTDGTRERVANTSASLRLCVKTIEHEWPGNQAAQFQWALDNLPIETKWILRLDADEYLTDELIEEIRTELPQMDDDVDGVVLKRRHVVGWLGNRWIKRGMYPTKILRLFRRGYGRSDMKIMDEHIIVQRRVVEFENDFVDHSLISFEEWKEKHRNYAKREAWSYLSGERSTGEKAAKKDAYYKLPRYFRAVAYFCIRYLLKLGFLDGIHGFRWHLWQGLWYRWQVDREIGRLRLERGLESAVEATGRSKIDLSQYVNNHSWRNKAGRVVWKFAWTIFARFTPRWALNFWRVGIIRAFGAKVGAHCRVPGGTDIWHPRHLVLGERVWIDIGVKLYCVNMVTLGNNVIISDSAYICTAEHDISDPHFKLKTAPVVVKDGAWIAAHAIILPGVTIGEGAVVAAGAVVTRDVPPWTVVAGSPARVVKNRELSDR